MCTGGDEPDPVLLVTVGRLLKQVYHSSKTAVDAALADHGCSLSQWLVLDRVAARPGVSARVLAQETCQTEQALGRLVARLAGRELIERFPRPGNATGHRLTTGGEQLLAECAPVVRDVLARELGGIGPAELRRLHGLLSDVVAGQPV